MKVLCPILLLSSLVTARSLSAPNELQSRNEDEKKIVARQNGQQSSQNSWNQPSYGQQPSYNQQPNNGWNQQSRNPPTAVSSTAPSPSSSSTLGGTLLGLVSAPLWLPLGLLSGVGSLFGLGGANTTASAKSSPSAQNPIPYQQQGGYQQGGYQQGGYPQQQGGSQQSSYPQQQGGSQQGGYQQGGYPQQTSSPQAEDELAVPRYVQCEGGTWNGRCPSEHICVGDPRSRGLILDSICVPTKLTCGGKSYQVCPSDFICVADPRQPTCQPGKGDLGCSGVCV